MGAVHPQGKWLHEWLNEWVKAGALGRAGAVQCDAVQWGHACGRSREGLFIIALLTPGQATGQHRRA